MIIKSLTWCQYSIDGFFFRGESDHYLLPGQAVPLKEGVLLKQAVARYTDRDLLVTNVGEVDDEDVIRKVQYENAFLPFRETGVATLEYLGRNYPMIGWESSVYDDLPSLTMENIRAMDWVKTAGTLLEVQEPHYLWIAVEAGRKDKSTKVWCPTQNKLVKLKPIDVPIVFAPVKTLARDTVEEGWLVFNTPHQDEQWWVWNASAVAGKRKVASRTDWLKSPDVYVNVTAKVSDAVGNNFYKVTDSKYRRLSLKKVGPPTGKFAKV